MKWCWPVRQVVAVVEIVWAVSWEEESLWLLPEKPPLLKVRQIVCFADKQSKDPKCLKCQEREGKVENALNSSYFRLLCSHKRKERKKEKTGAHLNFLAHPSIINDWRSFFGGNYENFSLTGIALLVGEKWNIFHNQEFCWPTPPAHIHLFYLCMLCGAICRCFWETMWLRGHNNRHLIFPPKMFPNPTLVFPPKSSENPVPMLFFEKIPGDYT